MLCVPPNPTLLLQAFRFIMFENPVGKQNRHRPQKVSKRLAEWFGPIEEDLGLGPQYAHYPDTGAADH